MAGAGAGGSRVVAYTPHVLLSDGSRVFFTVPPDDSTTSGGVYMRDDHGTVDTGDDTTVRIDASERTVPDVFSPSLFWGASTDGSRVFFSTSEALTDDAPVNGQQKLYLYDTTKPDSDPHNLTYVNVDNVRSGAFSDDLQGVIATSDDGQYVYFITTGQIVPGGPTDIQYGIYVWHDGVVRWLGSYDSLTDDLDRTGLASFWTAFALTPDTRVSPDGRHLLFMTRSDEGFVGHGGFAGYDHGSTCTADSFSGLPCRELYLYDAASGEHPRCVSCDPAGRVGCRRRVRRRIRSD